MPFTFISTGRLSTVPMKAPLAGLAPVLPFVRQNAVLFNPFRVEALTFVTPAPLPTISPVRLTELKLLNPAPLPLNTPIIWLAGLVAMSTPAKLFVPVNRLLPASRGSVAGICPSVTLPSRLVAVPADVA